LKVIWALEPDIAIMNTTQQKVLTWGRVSGIPVLRAIVSPEVYVLEYFSTDIPVNKPTKSFKIWNSQDFTFIFLFAKANVSTAIFFRYPSWDARRIWWRL